MKPNWTVMAAFEDRVAARFDAAFVNGSALGWIARNTSKPKRNWKIDCWVLQASSAWSQAHLDDQPDDVGSFLMEAFDDLIPAGLPKAFYATVHRWRHAHADPPLAVGAIHDQESRITLCGDWCKGSRIEDAYLSGLEAAQLPDPRFPIPDARESLSLSAVVAYSSFGASSCSPWQPCRRVRDRRRSSASAPACRTRRARPTPTAAIACPARD